MRPKLEFSANWGGLLFVKFGQTEFTLEFDIKKGELDGGISSVIEAIQPPPRPPSLPTQKHVGSKYAN